MATIYVIRTFGGVLIIGQSAPPSTPLPTVLVATYTRDGIVSTLTRDGITKALARDGITQARTP